MSGRDGDGSGEPSLSGIASFERDAWVIDGGVLDNAPFRPALEAIRRAPASGPVQRVLCYVTPYSTSPEERAASRAAPPPLGTVVGAAFNLPRDVTLTETLEDVADYKQRVRNRRASRGTVAVRLGDDGLARQARAFHDDYVSLRAATSADDVLRRFVAGTVGRRAQGAARAVQRPVASGARLVGRGVLLPWIPGTPRDDAEPWAWGLAPIGRSSLLVLDLLARTLAVTPSSSDPEDDAALARIVEARSQLSAVGAWVRLRREAYFAAAETRYRDLPLSSDALRPVLTAWNGADLDFEGSGRRSSVISGACSRSRRHTARRSMHSGPSPARRWSGSRTPSATAAQRRSSCFDATRAPSSARGGASRSSRSSWRSSASEPRRPTNVGSAGSSISR